MNKKPQESLEQLNNQAPVEFMPEETYDLEDIIREFGGWTKTEPSDTKELPKIMPESEAPVKEAAAIAEQKPVAEEAVPVQAEESAPLTDEPKEEVSEQITEVMRVAAADSAAGEKNKARVVDFSGDTIRFRPIGEEDLRRENQAAAAVEMPAEPVPHTDAKILRAQQRAKRRSDMRLRKQERQRRNASKAALRAARREQPEVIYPSAEDACADYGKTGTLNLRIAFSAALCALSAVFLILGNLRIGAMDMSGYSGGFAVVMLALLIVQCVVSYEIFIRGIYQALRVRFDMMSLLVLVVLISAADSFVAIGQGRLPFCTSAGLLVWIALWSTKLEKKAKWRTLKTVLAMEHPMAASKEEKAWHGLDCVFRTEGSLDDFTAMLETPDAAQKIMRIYTPAAALVTMVMAAICAISGQSDFLWAWSALLTAAMPVGCFIACCRPFAILAKRLQQDGAAICGWRGAKLLSGECGIVIEDSDLFPKNNITMNGMKMYSDLPARQVVGYATAVIQAAGSGLLPLFEEVMKQEDGRRYKADSFRQYEGGGLGAEIRGDVVLLGSLAFMRLMGVPVPEGTKVQSALYISVNKELVGVFALTYQPSAGTRNGLGRIMRSAGLTPVLATRDFMITPALVKRRYKVSVERMEFPVVAERIHLSADNAGKNGEQGALMAKESFMSFAAAVTGGRLLRKTVHSSVALALFSGLLGLGLMGLLTWYGSVLALSASNLLLYQLIWMVPTLLVTGLVGKT